MKCRINPKYRCFKRFKCGKGLWDTTGDPCEKCVIYQRAHQISLVQADPNRIFKCPKCLTKNVWYLHETNVFRCKYCGHLFQEGQAVTK